MPSHSISLNPSISFTLGILFTNGQNEITNCDCVNSYFTIYKQEIIFYIKILFLMYNIYVALADGYFVAKKKRIFELENIDHF